MLEPHKEDEMAEGRVRAVVKVILEVEADSVWSSNTTWDQIAGQAEDSVRGLLTSGNALAMRTLPQRIMSLQMVEVKIRQEGR
jgi:hypothetical protein